jgi:hypothetical protein
MCDPKSPMSTVQLEFPRMHGSNFPDFPEGPFVLMAGGLQSELGVAFSAQMCLV